MEPATALATANFVLGLFGTAKSKSAADRAAEAAREAAEFNAKIVERDIDILERQSKLVDVSQLLREKVSRFRFSQMQGSVITGFASAGIDISQGTPMRVLRQNAREFEYDMAVNRFNDSVTQMQIADGKENARLSAELMRMEGGAQAGAIAAQGTRSLISGIGQAFQYASGAGLFDEGAFRSSPVGMENFGAPPMRPSTSTLGGSQIRIG